MAMRSWLMKSEPGKYSIHDLRADGRTCWEGVRNYQARNFMREMQVGDGVLFYHSSATPPGVAGIARVCRTAYPDATARDRRSHYYDPKATADQPIWEMVDIEFKEAFQAVVSLDALKGAPELADLWVLRKGQRLSVQPVEAEHFRLIRAMGRGA